MSTVGTVQARTKTPIPPIIHSRHFLLDEWGGFIIEVDHSALYAMARYWSKRLACTVVGYDSVSHNRVTSWCPIIWYRNGLSIRKDKHNPHVKGAKQC